MTVKGLGDGDACGRGAGGQRRGSRQEGRAAALDGELRDRASRVFVDVQEVTVRAEAGVDGPDGGVGAAAAVVIAARPASSGARQLRARA